MSKKKLSLKDKLCTIFVIAGEKSNKRGFKFPFFRISEEGIQRVFYEITQNRQCSILDELVYVNRAERLEAPPYCPVLGRAIKNLFFSEFIKRRNGNNLEELYLNPQANRYYERAIRPRLKREEIKQFESIVYDFLKRLPA